MSLANDHGPLRGEMGTWDEQQHGCNGETEGDVTRGGAKAWLWHAGAWRV